MTQGFHVSIKFRRLFKKHWFPSRVRSGDQATNGCILFRGHVFYHISSSLTSNSDCQNKNVMRQEETMVVIFRFNIEIHLMTLLIIREKLLIAWWIKLTQMVWDSDVIKALSAWVVGQFYFRNIKWAAYNLALKGAKSSLLLTWQSSSERESFF